MGYYPNTIKIVRDILKKEYLNTEAKEGLDDLPSHLLWMLDRIEEMENTPGKAGRWIGYVLGRMETLGLISNQESKDSVRKDILEGYE